MASIALPPPRYFAYRYLADLDAVEFFGWLGNVTRWHERAGLVQTLGLQALVTDLIVNGYTDFENPVTDSNVDSGGQKCLRHRRTELPTQM